MDHNELAKAIRDKFGSGYGVKSRAARFLNVSHPFISMCLKGERPIPDRFAVALLGNEGDGSALHSQVFKSLSELKEATDMLGFDVSDTRMMVRDLANLVFTG